MSPRPFAISHQPSGISSQLSASTRCGTAVAEESAAGPAAEAAGSRKLERTEIKPMKPLLIALLVLTAVPAYAQRLPDTVMPGALRSDRRAGSGEGDLCRPRSDRRDAEGAVEGDRSQRRRDHVRRRADCRRRQDADRGGDARCGQGSGDVHRPGRRFRPARHGFEIAYQRHPERRPARAVPEQGQQPPLRGDPARGDRRAAHVPVVRRAGVQGHLRAHGDRSTPAITRSRTAP